MAVKWKYKKAYHKHEGYDSRHGFFEIEGEGGFCTIRTYWLSWYDAKPGGEPIISRWFFKLQDAKEWTERFVNGGAVVDPMHLKSLY